MLNPIFSKKVQGQKHPGRWGIVEHQIPSIKMLFKTNTKSHKHPSIGFLSKSKTQLVNQRKKRSGIQPRNRVLPYRTWWGAASPILNDTPVVYTTYNRTRIRNVHIYIYTFILTQSFWTGTKVISRKHIVQCLDSLLGYSAGIFQALQLIVLVLASCILVQFLKI